MGVTELACRFLPPCCKVYGELSLLFDKGGALYKGGSYNIAAVKRVMCLSWLEYLGGKLW